MRKLTLLAQWAGDFERASAEYDSLLMESLGRGDPVEARLLYAQELLCQVVLSMERGERNPSRVVNKITKEKELQARDLHAARPTQEVPRENLLQAALRAGAKVTVRALKQVKLYQESDQQLRPTPLRQESEDRFVSVFIHPRGFEARSYCRTDVTVNLPATGERLTQRGHRVKSHTDRMLEVEVQREVMELFVDGRIRCISESQEPSRIAHLVNEIAGDFVFA
jgi:hypothetical protein